MTMKYSKVQKKTAHTDISKKDIRIQNPCFFFFCFFFPPPLLIFNPDLRTACREPSSFRPVRKAALRFSNFHPMLFLSEMIRCKVCRS